MLFSQTSPHSCLKVLPPAQSYDICCSSSEIWHLFLNLRRASKSNVWYLRILLRFPLACLLVLMMISVFLCYMSMSCTGLRSSLSCLAKCPRHCRFQQSKSNSSWSTHVDEVHSQLAVWWHSQSCHISEVILCSVSGILVFLVVPSVCLWDPFSSSLAVDFAIVPVLFPFGSLYLSSFILKYSFSCSALTSHCLALEF